MLFFWVVLEHFLYMSCLVQMKTWNMIFLYEICNFLYFPCENMGADISTWNRKPVFHVWKSTCILCFIMYGILSVSHMDICGHVFLHEWGILYISDMKIWAYMSLLELYTFLIWKSQWVGWKQPRCPSADEWIRKLWYVYTMEY